MASPSHSTTFVSRHATLMLSAIPSPLAASLCIATTLPAHHHTLAATALTATTISTATYLSSTIATPTITPALSGWPWIA